MLPILAMLVAGYMAKQRGAGDASPLSASGGGLGILLGGLLNGRGGKETPGSAMTGLASMLDLDGDGNPLDDILQIVGKTMR